MIAAFVFDWPVAWFLGLPLAALLLLSTWRRRRGGLSWPRLAVLLGLRILPILVLLFLLARPGCAVRARERGGSRPVVVLVDRSESMSLKEPDTTRYQRALDFLGRRLLPALNSAHLPVQGMLFDQGVEFAAGDQISSARPEGKRTNLGGAIADALAGSPQLPLAVVTLTDGLANVDSDNERAVSALVDSRVPFIGVGFGGDQGVQTLSLRRINGPATVAPGLNFSLSAELEMLNSDQESACDLVLFRDGQAVQRKAVKIDKGSSARVENFPLKEAEQGVHEYTVQLLPANLPNLKCVDTQASTSVRVCDQSELRIFYVQGALTWDYKFIRLALKKDPALKLTGLTKTSQQSQFRQNVEDAAELLNGFPTSLEQFAPFRVVVLSNLNPDDLSPAQQELLARYCSELGGGLLMIGGPSTFNRSWQNSRLEQILPVVLPGDATLEPSAKLFQVELTPDAAQNPVFQLSENAPAGEAWTHLPGFNQFARVHSAKLGAQVWLVRADSSASDHRRILMASQRYGSGISAAICLQNLWRWRLAKDSDPAQFDRFWRQLFRWLGNASQGEVSIQFADQRLSPHQDLHIQLERTRTPQNSTPTDQLYLVQVLDKTGGLALDQSVELPVAQPTEITFTPAKPDVYTIQVMTTNKTVLGTRSLEVRDNNLELAQTGRNMETLQQWAAVSGGLAFKIEECPKAADLVAQIKSKVQEVQRTQQTRSVVGLNWCSLAIVLGCLSAEWILRKRWALV